MVFYIILDYTGSRRALVKAETREEAHQIYSSGIKFLIDQTFCVTEAELKEIKKNIKKL